jgi:hypothetical protein
MALSIPQDYLDYVRTHGIFEGETSDDAEPGYIELWSPDAIRATNEDIEIESLAPGFVAFAGNGGGEALAFDAGGAVYMLPLIGMAPECAEFVAKNFKSLAERFVR